MPLVVTIALALFNAGCGGDDDNASTTPPPTNTNTNTNTTNTTNTNATAVTVSIPQGATGMGAAAYGTNPLRIQAGTKVTWVNNDSMAHTATSGTGAWDSGSIAPGQQYSFTFNDAGVYPYFCAIHGQASMSGTIEVAPGPSPTVSTSPVTSPSPSVSGSPEPIVTLTPVTNPSTIAQ